MYELGLLYLVLFPLFLFISLGKYKIAIVFIVFIVFLSILFSSRTYFITASDDIFRYYHSYLRARDYSLFQYIDYIDREIIYTAGNWFAYQIFGHISPRFYLFITSLTFNCFMMLALVKIFKNNKYKLFIVFAILSTPVMVGQTQLVRQLLSFAIFLLAFSYPNRIAQVLLFVFALGIHKVSIIFFCVLWSYKWVGKLILTPFVLIVGVIIAFIIGRLLNINSIIDFLVIIPFIGDKAYFLVGIDITPLRFGVTSLFSLFCFLFIAFRINKISFCDEERKLFYVMFFILFASLIFSFVEAVSARFFYYFYGFLPWFYIIFIQSYFKSKNQKILITFLFLFLVLLFFRESINKYTGFTLFNGELTNKLLIERK